MKKEIKNFEKIMEISLIILTIISLIINALEYTNMIYNNSYDTTNLNDLLVSTQFTIILWVDNILIYIVSIFYIMCAIESKNNCFIKISFTIFSIVTTIVVSNFIINFVARIFRVFLS